MINFVKNFKNWVPEGVQYIIWIVLLASAIFFNVLGSADLLGFLQNFLSVALGVIAVWIIYAKKEYLAAYLLLFIMGYADQFGTFIRSILSFNLNSLTFTSKPTWQIMVGMIGTIYLLLMIISYYFNSKVTLKYKHSQVLFPLFLAFVYGYFRFGFLNSLVFILPPTIALLIGSPLAAILLLMGNFVSQPFQIINNFISGAFKFTSVFYWLYSIAAIYIIYLTVIITLHLIRSKEEA